MPYDYFEVYVCTAGKFKKLLNTVLSCSFVFKPERII